MRSPFPGMDPYLERHWRDVHARLVHNACNAINRQLGADLRARIEERLVIETDVDPVRAIYPDVRVFERGRPTRPLTPAATGMALAEPLIVSAGHEEATETYVEIIDVSSGGRLVTILEFISPSNKLPGDGQRNRQKQAEALAANVNMVEIDLTRGGQRALLYPTAQLPPSHQTTYLACVYRGFSVGQYEIYPLPLKQRLPAIRIPLRDTDPDAALDIQALVDQAYEEGRYDDIDYRRPCTPPLEGEDAVWADGLLRSAGHK